MHPTCLNRRLTNRDVRLTEQLLADSSQESVSVVKAMLFDHLAPILALKVVPFRAFNPSQYCKVKNNRLRKQRYTKGSSNM